MAVELNPETEPLVQQELENGYFHSVDEMITTAVNARRKKSKAPPRKPRKNLADFLSESTFAGSELDLERQQDNGRPLDL